MSEHPEITLTRKTNGVYLHTRGATQWFSLPMWEEYSTMIQAFNITGSPEMRNFVPLPTRTPLHDNTPTPRKPTLEDLV